MELKRITNKFGYNEELTSFLERIYPLLISYFKDEKLIYDALDDCRISLCNDLCKLAKSGPELYDALELTENIEICGAYLSEPYIYYNDEDKKFEIRSVQRDILINGSDLLYDEVKSSLIHEICHLIKSYNREFEIKNDLLIHRSGFLRTISRISREYSINADETIFTNGMGIEEGLNVYIEKEICNHIGINREVEDEYAIVYEMAKVLMKFPIEDMRDIIIKSQIYHNNDLIDTNLGEGFYKLQDFADEVYFKTFSLINNASNYDERDHIFEELCNYVNNNYKDIIESMRGHARKRGVI